MVGEGLDPPVAANCILIMELPKRKSPRIKEFDYSSSRYYFITVCTHHHQNYFGSVKQNRDNGIMVLNHYGEIAKRHIEETPAHHNGVFLIQYVIMPNHIHLVIELDNHITLPITTVIGLLKSGISREIGFSVWQRSFHDHIIRNEIDYKRIWQYIENNPAKWAMDKYYNESDL